MDQALISSSPSENSVNTQENEPGEFSENYPTINFRPTFVSSDTEESSNNNETTSLLPVISRTSTSTARKHSFSIITGNSTSPQTIFNSINTLVGIGMLSLSYGFRLSGWIYGSILLIVSATLTSITAKYLGRILRNRPHLMTYADISREFGGTKFSYFVTFFFIIDLFGASLTLIILFADCFSMIWSNVVGLKIILVTILFFLSLLPLNLLSFLSLFGILATVGIIVIIFICGFIIPTSPGSLLSPSPTTTLLPPHPIHLLLSLGIMMAPFGGHPIFPEIARDMRHPSKYPHTTNISFLITFILDYTIAIVGYLMYGSSVDDSIIKSILNNPRSPRSINAMLCLLMGVLPVSKLPLITKPIITSYENIMGITEKYVSLDQKRTMVRILARVGFMGFLLVSSLVFTSFGKMIAFLGSAICYTVCLTLPLLFYLRLNKDEVGEVKGWVIRVGIVCSIICAVLGSFASITLNVD
ncbi:AVT1 Vacuolar amino acid transporter 1 [Candida maltosa Xu316]